MVGQKTLWVSKFIYIYIYRERERERETYKMKDYYIFWSSFNIIEPCMQCIQLIAITFI